MKKRNGLWNALASILGWTGLVLVAAVLLAGLLVGYTIRRSFPQVSGRLQIPGLISRVEIYRDADGIPHIYADNPHDLFLAQGFVHAQDRFYQMDFWRHQTAGRLSELYGESQARRDRFLRTVGWRRVAEEEYRLLDSETRAVLDAYAEGVNAYVRGRPAPDLSLEYTLLALNGLAGYQPEPWSAIDSLAWAKAMAWDLGGNMDEEIDRAILTEAIGEEKTADYMPFYPADHPIIIPNPATAAAPGQEQARFRAAGPLLPALQGLRAQLASVNALTGGGQEGLGSNNWVIAGSRTTTGKPLLADDPHLGIQMPAIWYEVGLHCRTRSSGCPYDVTGFSLAGDPGVVIGHNNRIAWGVTNVGPDVQDLVIERLNPANLNQYELNGAWVDMEIVEETIRYRGGGQETVTIRYTRHGPLITEVYETEKMNDMAAQGELDPAYQYAFALRWTALEPSFIFRSVLAINKAQNWQEFRQALRDWAVPSQNFVYADVDGNIGYQTPGNIPIRRGGDGTLPAPGWTDEYEWTGYIPFEELPYSYNPPQGYIATANNAVVGPDYPYLIELSWDAGYRARRIVDMIETQPKISPEYIQQIQGDNLNLGAAEVLPHLLALRFDEPELAQAQEALRGWDGQMDMDSRPAAIYMGFYNTLLAQTFHDDLPEDFWPSGGGSNWLLLRKLLAEPGSAWWDNTATSAVETRDDILRSAFVAGYDSLQKRLGEDADTWKWGQLHTATFSSATLGSDAVPAAIRALFNRGAFPTSGGASIVNATDWAGMARDDKDSPSDPYVVRSLPSLRMIVDLGDLSNSLTIHTTGQSGHAYHSHYIDMADRWRMIEYHPMLWDRADVAAWAEGYLELVPGGMSDK